MPTEFAPPVKQDSRYPQIASRQIAKSQTKPWLSGPSMDGSEPQWSFDLRATVHRPAVPLLASQRFGGIDAEAASGRTQRREDADEQHERGRAGEDAGNRQAADLFDRHVPAG
jgi:hypothetical protein